MAEILGIVGSVRRWGNSELLVRQTLLGAQAEGASTQMLRLTDLRLESCTGCLRCVIYGKPCHQDDDMAWFSEVIQAFDGLVLAAPTYFLGPAAVIKLTLDRMLTVTGNTEAGLPPPRPAVTIATAGLEGWHGVTLPYLNAFVFAFGYRPIESMTAVAPGPGEVLLQADLMARVFTAGQRLGLGELEPVPAPDNTCPVCHGDSFTLHDGRAICPICGREGMVEYDGGQLRLSFDPATATEHRWTPEALGKHIVEWVRATGPRFMARRSEIKARRSPYREMAIPWLCPPSTDVQPKEE